MSNISISKDELLDKCQTGDILLYNSNTFIIGFSVLKNES